MVIPHNRNFSQPRTGYFGKSVNFLYTAVGSVIYPNRYLFSLVGAVGNRTDGNIFKY